MKYIILNFFTQIISPFWNILPLYVKSRLMNNKIIVGRLKFLNDYVLCYINSIDSYFRLSSYLKEPNMINWFNNHFVPGDVFYDIGANIGSYSLISQKLFNNKLKVYAFEPSVSTFTNLCNNIVLNNQKENIVPLNLLLSSTSGVNIFSYSSFQAGSAGHHINFDGENQFHQLMYAYSLDQVVLDLNIPYPNHIKIDVDGNELSVLQGMTAVLSSSKLKSIQIEFDSSFSGQHTEIESILRNYNFVKTDSYSHQSNLVMDCIYIKRNL